jgi:hypothetical protein
MRASLFQQAHVYHADMPGIIRATLNDFGLADEAIDLHLIGWDGRRVTKPLFDCDGRVVNIERYELAAGGKLARLIRQLTW